MIAPARSRLHAVAPLLIAALLACGDAPTGPQPEDSELLIISDAPSAASLRQDAPAIRASTGFVDGIAYVSLAPGSIPDGQSVTVTNLASGTSFSRVMVEGGFDPVAIAASAGDTLELAAARPAGMLVRRAVVPAARRPRVVRASPAKGRTDVALNASIVVVFSEPVDPATIGAESVRLLRNGAPIPGSLRLGSGQVAVEFTPAQPLDLGATYSIDLGNGIADLAGDLIEGTTSFEFTASGVASPPPGSDAWVLRGTLGGTDRYGTAGAVIDGVLYVVGGRSDCCPWDYGSESPLQVVEAFDLATGEWTARRPMPTPRYDLAVGVVDGILYAVGGTDGSNMFGIVEAYDPATDTWTTVAPMPTPRLRLGVGVVGGRLYAIGGLHHGGVVEAYDPASDTWTPKADMPTHRVGLGIGVAGGLLYAIDGAYATPDFGSGDAATVEVYDPATDTWSSRAPTPTPLYRHAAAVGDKLYAVGVGDARVAIYDPAANAWSAGPSLPSGSALTEAVAAADGALHTVVMRFGTTGTYASHVYSLVP